MVIDQLEGDRFDGFGRFLILWFWKEEPGGGIASWFFEKDDAQCELETLNEHGDPRKRFVIEEI